MTADLLHNKYLLFLSRVLLGTVFIVASIDKIAHAEVFAASIEGYRLLPVWSVNMLALVVPWLELVCGIFLLAGVYVRPSSWIIGFLLFIFIGAMTSVIVRGLAADCGCFGAGVASPVTWMRVLEDVGLLVLAVYLEISSNFYS